MSHIRITASDTMDVRQHRSGITCCPHCQASSDTWDERAFRIVLNPLPYHKGCVAMESSCRECYEPSWVHESFSKFNRWSDLDEDIVDAVQEYATKVRLKALRDWKNGLCGNCLHLKSGKVDESTWRECVKGFGPVVTGCDRYEELT